MSDSRPPAHARDFICRNRSAPTVFSGSPPLVFLKDKPHVLKRLFFLFFLILFFFADAAKAEEGIDEDAFFSNPETVVDDQDIVNSSPSNEMKKSSFGVSAELANYNTYNLFQEKGYENTGEEPDERTAILVGNLFLAARFQHGFKLFSNLEAQYQTEDSETDSFVRELIVDDNIGQRVFFKMGKQVLHWGRCYLWNPTDLINIEKKQFVQKTGYREGTKGIKMHVPFGTTWNLYGFLEMENTDCPDDFGGAFKVEYLTGATEMAFSIWGKDGFQPVYGYDVSTRILKIDLAGEWSVSHGSNVETVQEENGIISKDKAGNGWVHRVCVNAGKSFDWGDQTDKITLTGEVFYNGDGYTDNLFKDKTVYVYQEPIDISGLTLAGGDKKTYLLAEDIYNPNYHSKYYAAIFATINKFIISDMAMNFNLIGNLNDRSSIFSAGITYKNIKDFSIGLTVYRFLGPDDAEYTFLGQETMVQLILGIVF